MTVKTPTPNQSRQAASLAFKTDAAQLWHADWRQLIEVLPRREDGTVCDFLCADPPYSETTHKGHDRGVINASDVNAYAAGKVRPYKRSGPSRERERRYARNKAKAGLPRRRTLNYEFWTEDDIVEFMTAWHAVTAGWIITMSDDVLAPIYRAVAESLGRMAFAPVPFVWPGSSVRLAGDGPTNWARYLMMSRPRNIKYGRWGALDGAYVTPAGFTEKLKVPGGKPLWLLDRLVEDYSDLGDIVCDPLCGAGTALVAAVRAGRLAMGGDLLEEHVRIAAEELASPRARTVSALARPRRPVYDQHAQGTMNYEPSGQTMAVMGRVPEPEDESTREF